MIFKMEKDKRQIAGRQIKAVTTLAIAANIVLFIIKLLVGLLTG